jgi:hypothetical protein
MQNILDELTNQCVTLGTQEKEREINWIKCKSYEFYCKNISTDETLQYLKSELIERHGENWFNNSSEAIKFIIEETYKTGERLPITGFVK